MSSTGPNWCSRSSSRFHVLHDVRARVTPSVLPRSGQRETNAKRLAAGLPPLRPRHLYGKGTRTGSAPRQLPSSGPSPTEWVTISVRDSPTGTSRGHISYELWGTDIPPDVYEVPRPGPGESWTTAREIHLVDQGVPPAPYWLAIQHMQAAWINVGAPPTIGPGDSNWLALARVDASAGPPGTLPEESTVYSETSVWVVEPSTGELRAHWTNPDGSAARAYFVACEGGNMFLTGDVALGVAQLSADIGGLECWPVDLRMTATDAPDA